MGENKNIYRRFYSENMKGRDYLREGGSDARITLECILKIKCEFIDLVDVFQYRNNR
jgi:hypothetical protein